MCRNFIFIGKIKVNLNSSPFGYLAAYVRCLQFIMRSELSLPATRLHLYRIIVGSWPPARSPARRRFNRKLYFMSLWRSIIGWHLKKSDFYVDLISRLFCLVYFFLFFFQILPKRERGKEPKTSLHISKFQFTASQADVS